LGEIASEIFTSVATLLNLDLDLVFVDSTSTYWEVDVAEDLVDLAEPVVDDDGTSRAGRVAVADQSRQPFGSRRYACRNTLAGHRASPPGRSAFTAYAQVRSLVRSQTAPPAPTCSVVLVAA
jgi:hypothetical protein